MTFTSPDKTTDPGKPFVRLLQPETPASPFTDSSYFRLGSYVAQNDEEKDLVTGLGTTTSTVRRVPPGPLENGSGNLGNAGAHIHVGFDGTIPKGDNFHTLASEIIPSSNDGVLIYTDRDLNEKVCGAALHRYGKGNVVEVTTADSAYTVKSGKHDLFAQNGIFLTAGTAVAPANIDMTAWGIIYLTAHGDLLETIHGEAIRTYKKSTSDFFMGTKRSFSLSAEFSMKFAATTSIIGGVDCTIRLSGKLTLTLSADANFNLGKVYNYLLGAKTDVVYGKDTKIVTGTSQKIVQGSDFKKTITDTKLVEVDLKTVRADIKRARFNATICDFDFKKEFSAAEDSKLAAKKAQIKTEFDKIVAGKTAVAEVRITNFTAFI